MDYCSDLIDQVVFVPGLRGVGEWPANDAAVGGGSGEDGSSKGETERGDSHTCPPRHQQRWHGAAATTGQCQSLAQVSFVKFEALLLTLEHVCAVSLYSIRLINIQLQETLS